MKTIIIFCLAITIFEIITENIVIDLNRVDKLSLSDISDITTVVSLESTEINNPGAGKVFLIDENIFILQRYQENGIHYSSVSRFDFSGNFKGKLVAKDPKSNELLYITNMQYDDTNKSIFLIFSSGYGIYDKTGNLITYNKYNWANGNNYILTPYILIFRGQIWFEEISKNDRTIDINFVHTDLSFQNKEIIKSIKSFPAEYKGVLPVINLSARNNELYISFKTDNTIYKVNNGEFAPVYKFVLKNRIASNAEITPNQKIVGKYIINGYWNNFIEYDFLYNSESNESYNIKYLHNQDMVYTSGIKDDIYNTGYFKFNPTNQDDYIFFFKNPAELKGNKLFDTKQSKTILFLVKLK